MYRSRLISSAFALFYVTAWAGVGAQPAVVFTAPGKLLVVHLVCKIKHRLIRRSIDASGGLCMQQDEIRQQERGLYICLDILSDAGYQALATQHFTRDTESTSDANVTTCLTVTAGGEHYLPASPETATWGMY